jgi:hypothetical protein
LLKQIATKICTACHKEVFAALFPSMKHSECADCSRERNAKYKKKAFGKTGSKRSNNLLFGKKGTQFEWERHLDLQ